MHDVYNYLDTLSTCLLWAPWAVPVGVQSRQVLLYIIYSKTCYIERSVQVPGLIHAIYYYLDTLTTCLLWAPWADPVGAQNTRFTIYAYMYIYVYLYMYITLLFGTVARFQQLGLPTERAVQEALYLNKHRWGRWLRHFPSQTRRDGRVVVHSTPGSILQRGLQSLPSLRCPEGRARGVERAFAMSGLNTLWGLWGIKRPCRNCVCIILLQSIIRLIYFISKWFGVMAHDRVSDFFSDICMFKFPCLKFLIVTTWLDAYYLLIAISSYL